MTTIIDHGLFDKLQKEILKLEQEGKGSEAIKKFEEYLEKIKIIGSYDIDRWRLSWTSTVWDFVKEISKDKIKASRYHSKISSYISDLQIKLEKTEFAEFILLELVFCLDDYNSDAEIEKSAEFRSLSHKLYQKYSYNNEFRYAMAHASFNNFSSSIELKKALELYKKCIICWSFNIKQIDREANIYKKKIISNFFEVRLRLISGYITEENYKEARLSFEEGMKDFNGTSYISLLYPFQFQIKHMESFSKKAEQINEENIKLFKKEMSNDKKGHIEILGIFSAIITFIIGTSAAYGKISLKEVGYLGLILILFVMTLHYIIEEKKKIQSL